MAFIHSDISGMSFTRSKPFTGMGPQPHTPMKPLMRGQRNDLGNGYMIFTDEARPPPTSPHFHKRPEYGGKLAQSMDSKSAYYAMLSPKYCLRSSLTGLERHHNGVKMLRECNNKCGPPEAPRSLTPDYASVHHRSLEPWPRLGATKTMRTSTPLVPSKPTPEIVRPCSLHRGWQTNFDAKGGVIMLDPKAGVRDTAALAQQTREVIEAQHVHVRRVQEAAREAVVERAGKIREEQRELVRENEELQQADYNYRRNMTQTERQSTYDKKNLLRTQRKNHQQDFASKEKADKLAFKEQAALRAQAELRQRQENCRRVKQGRMDAKKAGEMKRKAQVDELNAMSLIAKRGEHAGASELFIEDEDAAWLADYEKRMAAKAKAEE